MEVVSNIEANLNRVQNEIAQAAQVSGRNVTDIELVAVTKTHPAEIVREAVDAGHLVFGERRREREAERNQSGGNAERDTGANGHGWSFPSWKTGFESDWCRFGQGRCRTGVRYAAALKKFL